MWRSSVYDHYRIDIKKDHSTQEIEYIFNCKYDNPAHELSSRLRQRAGREGTTGLWKGARQCDIERLSIAQSESSALKGVMYSFIAHRVLIALRCAASHRPFNMVNDYFYQLEVELLHPGARLPSAATVSSDLKIIYLGFSNVVSDYIRSRKIYFWIITDTWTSPQGGSEQGLVIQWYENGRMYRTILEFIG